MKRDFPTQYAYRVDLARRQGFQTRCDKDFAFMEWRREHPLAKRGRGLKLRRVVTVDRVILMEVPDPRERELVSCHWRAIRNVLAGNDGNDTCLWAFEGCTVVGFPLLYDINAVRPEMELLEVAP